MHRDIAFTHASLQIVIYALLGVIQGILFFAFSIITCVVGTKASQTMSNTAMWRILRAPMAFFDTTPLGRILHRFTNDVDTMDNNLTDSIRQYIVVMSSLASTFILIIVYFPYVRSKPSMHQSVQISNVNIVCGCLVRVWAWAFVFRVLLSE